MEQRTHPVTLFQMVWRFLFLLIIPAARGFVTALTGGNLNEWIDGAWYDILVVFVIFALAFLQWWCLFYSYDEVGLQIRRGVVIKRRQFVPAKNIVTMSVTDPFYLKPFGAVRLRADTWAGTSKSTDILLILKKAAAKDFLHRRQEELNGPDFSTREYHPKGLYITCLSAILSSSFAGVLFLSTFISQTGSLLGKEFSDRITGTFERITRAIAWGLPPATVALAYLLLFGWLLSFSRNLLRHANFVVYRGEDELYIKSGLFTNRSYSVQVGQINFIDIRQSLMTKFLGLHSVFVSAVGYGKEKDDISAMIPANSWNKMLRHLHFLLPEFVVSPRQTKPNRTSILRFLWDPLAPCLFIPVAGWVLSLLFPSWKEFISSIAFMAMFPAVWFLLVRVFDFLSTGISLQDDMYTLRYSAGIHLHTVIMPKDRVAQVILRQSPAQAFDRKCDLLIYSSAEKPTKHHLRNIDVAQAMALFDCDETAAQVHTGKRPFVGVTEYIHPYANYFTKKTKDNKPEKTQDETPKKTQEHKPDETQEKTET